MPVTVVMSCDEYRQPTGEEAFGWGLCITREGMAFGNKTRDTEMKEYH